MKQFCIITPDRNDRPELLNHCIWQMSRQTLQPAKHYIVNWPEIKEKKRTPDLTPRVMAGIKQAIADGFEYAFIIENDDYYPIGYLEMMFTELIRSGSDFIGINKTVFYMIQKANYFMHDHPGRASLFCTGFKLSAMEKFPWPAMSCLYLDMKIWDYAKTKTQTLFRYNYSNTLLSWAYPIGIKHGEGFSPGTGHRNEMQNIIPDNEYIELRNHVPHETFRFYKQHFNI